MQSQDKKVNQVRDFHRVMDGSLQAFPEAFSPQRASYRAEFKVEEIVEFLRASVETEEAFGKSVEELHGALDKAADKVRRKTPPSSSLVGQADALIDLLYFTYGSFVLMGIDPHPLFDIVHRANMGKVFPDGKAHFDPVTHKILKPDNWEQIYAPEPAIRAELDRQLAESGC